MSFYRRYQKKLKKGEKELTEEEKRKVELRNNIILVVLLVVGFGLVLLFAGQFKTEVTTYDSQLYVTKNVTDMPEIDKIKPLYTYEEEIINYATVEISDEGLYMQITDEIYADYEKYHDFYNKYVWKEYNLQNVKYFKFEVEIGKSITYYYIIGNKLYKTNELMKEIDTEKLTLLESTYVNDIYKVVEFDIPQTFGDYIEYIVDLNYYMILTEKQNSITGKVILEDDAEFNLSLLNFSDLIGLFNKSHEDMSEIIVEIKD